MTDDDMAVIQNKTEIDKFRVMIITTLNEQLHIPHVTKNELVGLIFKNIKIWSHHRNNVFNIFVWEVLSINLVNYVLMSDLIVTM